MMKVPQRNDGAPIQDQLFSGGLTVPDYSQAGLIHLANTLFSLFQISDRHDPLTAIWQPHLADRRFKKVVLLVLDGFGYRQWIRYQKEHAFLANLADKGLVAPIRTVFPSTTAAAMTTIYSGLPPAQHGLLEWFQYFREINEVVMTLPFCHIGGKKLDELRDEGVDPRLLFSGNTIYEKLARQGISSFIFHHKDFIQSAYTTVATAGGTVMSYRRLSDLLVSARRTLHETTGRSLLMLYWSAIDSAGHNFGTHSEAYQAEIRNFCTMMQEEFVNRIDPRVAEETVLFVVADHGQVPIEPERTFYLNDISELTRSLAKNSSGGVVAPWGSGRDVFLAVEPAALDRVENMLRDTLGAHATILRSAEARVQGWFGPGSEHPELASRAGSLMILPHGHTTVWFEHVAGVRLQHRGLHGGLTEEEMMIPCAVAPLDAVHV